VPAPRPSGATFHPQRGCEALGDFDGGLLHTGCLKGMLPGMPSYVMPSYGASYQTYRVVPTGCFVCIWLWCRVIPCNSTHNVSLTVTPPPQIGLKDRFAYSMSKGAVLTMYEPLGFAEAVLSCVGRCFLRRSHFCLLMPPTVIEFCVACSFFAGPTPLRRTTCLRASGAGSRRVPQDFLQSA
jgi:hypothetical protein